MVHIHGNQIKTLQLLHPINNTHTHTHTHTHTVCRERERDCRETQHMHDSSTEEGPQLWSATHTGHTHTLTAHTHTHTQRHVCSGNTTGNSHKTCMPAPLRKDLSCGVLHHWTKNTYCTPQHMRPSVPMCVCLTVCASCCCRRECLRVSAHPCRCVCGGVCVST